MGGWTIFLVAEGCVLKLQIEPTAVRLAWLPHPGPLKWLARRPVAMIHRRSGVD